MFVKTIDIFTACKRSLGQRYIFTGVCHSVNRGGGSASVHAGIHPPAEETPCQRDPLPRRHPPAKETPLPRRPPPAKETPSAKETPPLQAHTQGEIQGDQVQANIQVGNSGGSGPDPPDDYCCGRSAAYWNAFLFFFMIVSSLALALSSQQSCVRLALYIMPRYPLSWKL